MTSTEFLTVAGWVAEGRAESSIGQSSGNTYWEPCYYANIKHEFEWYRRKPEPRLRAWNLSEVPVGMIVRNKASLGLCVITSCELWIGLGADTYKHTGQELLQFYEFIDGRPCGILEP